MGSKASRKKRGDASDRSRAVQPPIRGAARRAAWPYDILGRALLLLLIGGVTYAGSLNGPFIFDDRPSIVESNAVRAWPNVRAAIDAVPESPFASRPLPSLTFAINYAIHGLDLPGYHVVNIATHLACALLIFGLARRTLGRARGAPAAADTNLAFAAALIWVVHPLNSEVVNYLTQRTESLMALFYLLTMYAGLRALDEERRTLWQALALTACALGMASKETMVTAPLIVVLYDRVFVFDSFRDALRARRRLYAGLAATLIILAASMLASPRTSSTGFENVNTSVWVYLLNQTVIITRYLRLTVWPDDLVLYYGFSRPTTLAAVWPYAVFVASLFVLSVVALIRRPLLGFAGAWFFITLSPASSFVPIASEVGAERRMYLPVIALIVLAVVGGTMLLERIRGDRPPSRVPGVLRAAPTLLVLALAVVLSARTMARTAEYASPLTMATTVFDRWPTPAARQMLGSSLVNAGRSEEALPYLRDAVEEMPAAYLDYGSALFNVNRLDEAIEQLQTYLRLESHSPSVPRARQALARALERTGRTDEAIEQLEDALTAEPGHAGHLETRGLLADALFSQQKFDQAIRYYRDFLAAFPRHPGALANLAIALASTGQGDEALDLFRRAAEADAANPQAHLNLAMALIEQDELAEAAGHAGRAVELAPDDLGARDLYGRLLAGVGRVPAAIEQFEQVLRLDPGNAPAREALRVLRGG